jgi:hypothetical protein
MDRSSIQESFFSFCTRGRYFLSRNKRALQYGHDILETTNRLKMRTSDFFYSRSFMMRATRLLGSTMAFRETPFITLSLVNVRILGALKTKQSFTNFSRNIFVRNTMFVFSQKIQSFEIIQKRCSVSLPRFLTKFLIVFTVEKSKFLERKYYLDLYDKRSSFRRCLLLSRKISKHGIFSSFSAHFDLPGSVYPTRIRNTLKKYYFLINSHQTVEHSDKGSGGVACRTPDTSMVLK